MEVQRVVRITMVRLSWLNGALFAALLFGPPTALGVDGLRVVQAPISLGSGRSTLPLQAVPGPNVQSVPVVSPQVSLAHPKTSEPMVLSSQDTLVQVAQLDPLEGGSIAFGDTDHDGRNEAVFYWHDQNFEWHYVIHEEQGNNVYSREYVGAELIPYAIGDLDRDGKSEIIGQFSYYVQVYESVDTSSYPTQLVWSSAALTNVAGFTTIGDTDRDGQMEIVHSMNTLGSSYLCIFENSGDNTYNLVFSTYTGKPAGEKVIADFDGDGLIEIAVAVPYGLHVYESPADNVWVETFSDTTGLTNSYAAEGGVDTDGNGIPELFIAGDRYTDYLKTTVVYEAIGDNQFTRIATLPLAGDFSAGGASNALGDLDGTGHIRYVFEGHFGFTVFGATGLGRWEIWSQEADPTPEGWYGGVQLFDVNQNARPELFWDSTRYPTLVLEHPPRTSDLGPSGTRPFQPLLLSPNPFRAVATIVAPSAVPGAEWLSVYDVAGRLVERLRLPAGQAHEWDARRLSAGVYYLQLESPSGMPFARGRGTIIR